MTSLSIKGIEVSILGTTFLSQCCVLSLSGLKFGVSLNDLYISHLLSLSNLVVSISSGFVHNRDDLSLYLTLECALLTLHLCNKYVSNLLCFDNGNLLVGVCSHTNLILFNLGSIDLGIQILHLSVIGTLHVSEFLVLLILKG